MIKVCSKCKFEKDTTEFYRTSGNRCKECHKKDSVTNQKANSQRTNKIARDWYYRNRERSIKKVRKWQLEHPERDKLSKLKRQLQVTYNLSYEDYCRMVDDQNGKCAICELVPTRRLDVDHNHTTGKVRKLLCSNCNTALGLLKESPELLSKAITYLETHNPLTQQS